MGVLENDLGSLEVELVDHLRYALLISGNRMGGKHDNVTRVDLNLLMDAAGHTGQSRHGLSLASGRDQDQLLIRVILHFLKCNQRILRNRDISKLLGRGDHVDHGAPLDHNLPVILVRHIDDLLHTVNIRREGRDNDAVVPVLREDRIKGLPDRLLRCRISGPLRIGGITHQSQNALSSDLGKPLKVNRVSKDRCKVHLEIARMHDRSGRAVNGERHGILDRVVRADNLYAKLLQLDQAHCQLCRVDRHIELPEDVGQRSDVILMSVRKDKAFHLLRVFQQVSNVRNHQIDPVHIVLRKCKAAVYHHDRIFIFERGNIHTDGLKSAQRYDL